MIRLARRPRRASARQLPARLQVNDLEMVHAIRQFQERYPVYRPIASIESQNGTNMNSTESGGGRLRSIQPRLPLTSP